MHDIFEPFVLHTPRHLQPLDLDLEVFGFLLQQLPILDSLFLSDEGRVHRWIARVENELDALAKVLQERLVM
jgi:hypothetical protein